MARALEHSVNECVVLRRYVAPRGEVVAAPLALVYHLKDAARARPCVGKTVDDNHVISHALRLVDSRDILLRRKLRRKLTHVVIAHIRVKLSATVLTVYEGDFAAQSLRYEKRAVSLAGAGRADKPEP